MAWTKRRLSARQRNHGQSAYCLSWSASESEQEQAAAFRLAYVGRANISTTNIAKDVPIASERRPQDRIASTGAVAMHRQASGNELRNASTRSSSRIMHSRQAIVNHGVSSSSSPTERGKELSSYGSGFQALCVRSYTRRFHPIFPMLHLESIESSKGSLLYFAIAAVGNHFTSSAKMLEIGEQLFDQVWNVVSASLGEASDQSFEKQDIVDSSSATFTELRSAIRCRQLPVRCRSDAKSGCKVRCEHQAPRNTASN